MFLEWLTCACGFSPLLIIFAWKRSIIFSYHQNYGFLRTVQLSYIMWMLSRAITFRYPMNTFMHYIAHMTFCKCYHFGGFSSHISITWKNNHNGPQNSKKLISSHYSDTRQRTFSLWSWCFETFQWILGSIYLTEEHEADNRIQQGFFQ